MTSKALRAGIAGVTAGAAAVAAYIFAVRPWHLKWGAEPEEAERPLPGDDRLPHPKVSATHAITIQAPVEKVWPWIVQMGQGRGGMYTYDWIENMMGLEMRSAETILPQFQNLKVGDVIPFEPGGGGPPVVALEPNRYLLIGGEANAQSEGVFKINDPTPGAFFAVSWLFYLEPAGAGATRLIERFRLDWYPPSLKNSIYMFAFLEPGAFVMERGMLMGIKKRAEKM